MRIPMVSALCIIFVSVSFPHPAAAQVNPGNLQSGGWSLVQQPLEAIDSTLAALKEKSASQSDLGEQLAHTMMRLTDKDHRPPWPLVFIFADNLTRELVGKQLTNTQGTALRECLSEAVRATGTSNARLASRLQETLTAIGLKSSRTQAIINDFVKLRESVQGPDDIPLRLIIPIPH